MKWKQSMENQMAVYLYYLYYSTSKRNKHLVYEKTQMNLQNINTSHNVMISFMYVVSRIGKTNLQ